MQANTIRSLLGQHELFAALSADALDELVATGDLISVDKGIILIAEGADSDCAYFVVAGRFVISVSDASGHRIVGIARQGEILGEMGLISGAPRTAAAHATRRSQVLRVRREQFEALLEGHQATTSALARTLVNRLVESNQRVADRHEQLALAVVGTDCNDTAAFAHHLEAAILRAGRSVRRVSTDEAAVDIEALGRAEVVLICAANGQNAAAAALADRTLFVTARESVPNTVDLPDPWDLVLLHRSARRPIGTATPIRQLGGPAFYHVAAGSSEDHDRLVRHLVGRPVTLALSGGAARGMVHLGLYRALVEAQIPIDAVAGTSAGSLVAAGVAQRWSADEVTEAIRLHTTPKSLLDVTLPMVALSAGRRVTDALERAFGSVEIEDCWIPFRAVSTNLTTLAAEIHRTGPLWRAVRASVAIPGVFPPLVEPRGVLVDGGLVINLPVAPLRAEFSKAFVISSLAWGPEKSQSGNRPASSGVVGAIEASRRLSRRRRGAREDGLLRTLTRLTSLGAAGTAQDRGDVHIDHDASAWGPFDWKAIDAITEVGYRTTRVAVSAGYFDEARAANPLGHSARA